MRPPKRVQHTTHITSATYEETEATTPALQDILVALSFALDLTEGAVPGHAIRSCLLAVRIALSAKLDADVLSDLYYACLLKDVGCSSNSARMCQIVGGDDRIVKAAAKLEDWTRPNTLGFSTIKLLWEQVLPGASVIDKTARLLKMRVTQHRNNRELIELRCDRGAQIVRKLGLGSRVATCVHHLDEHWDGGGYPRGLKGKEIPIISRLMCIAQHLDAFCMDRGPQVAIDTLWERSGRWFDPALVKAAISLHKSGKLWHGCLPGEPVDETRRALLDLRPMQQAFLSASEIDTVCEAFADVVDAKSPFTFRHSLGVMDAAVAIGNTLGLSDRRIQVLRRAALLHDVGKLGISNVILDKPGKLTDAEFASIKGHPELSSQILNRVQAFNEIAVLAGEHHEKLDGSGYPFGLTGRDMSVESRIIAVADLFAALSEHRPYREALGVEKIKSIMEREAPQKLDPDCYAALCVVMEDLVQSVRAHPVPVNIPRCEPTLEFAETFI